MPALTIGVDLGGTNLRVAAADEDGQLLEKITLGTQVMQGRDFLIADMCEAIRELAAKFSRSHTLAGIGVGVPGIIDKDTGMVRESPNLPGWHDYPVRSEIERQLGTRVFLENDANAAALGEFWMGAARDVGSLCMLTLGTGVGGGLVLDGRIWHGMNGMAGELGHVTVYPDGHPCGCGNRGCLEQYASATAIKRMTLEAIEGGKAPDLARALRGSVDLSARLVYQQAAQGDAAARAIFDQVGTALGIAIAGLINIFNLPMYVIGGGVASAWEMFAPALMREVKRRSLTYRATSPDSSVPMPPHKRTVIARAVLGSDAGLMGAARLPLVVSADLKT